MGIPIIEQTDFTFPDQTGMYRGKVRDVYDFDDSLMIVTTDRYSAFDRNLAVIPHKGQLLTQISKWWFEQTSSIVQNHIISYPDPNVAWCKKYQVIPIEVIVRGFITGVTNTSLWHTYSAGQRDYGDFKLPDGLQKNDRLPHAVLTPSTKFEVHDRNLTPSDAVAEGLIDKSVWESLQKIALELFEFGQEKASESGFMLVDTKYEFGLDDNGQIVLIDELHTPDSSRYWDASTYQEQIDSAQEPDNFDKEYLRLWYKERFDPYADGEAPAVPSQAIDELSRRYITVYEALSGQTFAARDEPDLLAAIEKNCMSVLGDRKL